MAYGGRPSKAARSLADLPLGSWRRTLITAVALVALFAAVIAAASVSGPLRHANFPGHPYPPPGFYINPFSGNPDDLVDAAEAGRVRADLLSDGQIELKAVEQGDVNALAQSRTGAALVKVQQIVADNNARGIAEREEVHLDAVVVGRLPDPNDPHLTSWCAEERGSGTITSFVKSTGLTQQVQRLTFDNKFWMVKVGSRYLIADVEVQSKPR